MEDMNIHMKPTFRVMISWPSKSNTASGKVTFNDFSFSFRIKNSSTVMEFLAEKDNNNNKMKEIECNILTGQKTN